jgi:hypothetical protein
MKNNFTDSKEDLCEIRDATVTRRTGLLDSLDLKHELKEALDEKKQFQKAFKQQASSITSACRTGSKLSEKIRKQEEYLKQSGAVLLSDQMQGCNCE